jgi:hypothetical protein
VKIFCGNFAPFLSQLKPVSHSFSSLFAVKLYILYFHCFIYIYIFDIVYPDNNNNNADGAIPDFVKILIAAKKKKEKFQKHYICFFY